MADLAQTLMTTLALGSLYALIALGYTMVYGTLKFINFAHSDIVVLGAWMSYTLASWILPSVGIDPLRPAGNVPPIWVAAVILLLSMIICGAVGFTIERLAYRPLRKAPRLNVLITAIGVSLLLQNLGQLDVTIQDIPLVGHPLNSLLQMIPGIRAITTQHFGFGAIPQRMPDLLPSWELLRVSLPNGDGTRNDVVFGLVDAMIIGASAVLMIALQYLVFRTKIGRAMRAVSFDFDAAALMGIPVDRVVSFTFVLGSVLAAAAGFLYALKYPGLNQTAFPTWVLLGLKAFVAAVIGGIGNIRGAVLGGFVIAFVEQFGSFYLGADYRDVYVFALLIVILLVRPSGLLGSTLQEKV
jgi:branched-chain amino acid transport system permease protein